MIMGMMNTNNSVLVVTTLVAYWVSPCEEAAKTGRMAKAGVADWTINVSFKPMLRPCPRCPPNSRRPMMVRGERINLPRRATMVSRSKRIDDNFELNSMIPI